LCNFGLEPSLIRQCFGFGRQCLAVSLRTASAWLNVNSVVCIDEIWRFWETARDVTPRTQNFFRMHRHMVHPDTNFACEIILITQSVDDVIRKVRSVVETTYVMSKHIELGTDKHYRIDIYSRAIIHRAEPINSYQKSYDPKFFALYKSHSTAEEGVEAVEKSIGRKATVWNKPIIKFGLPLSFIFFCVAFFLLWRFFHPAESIKQDVKQAKNTDITKQKTQTIIPAVMNSPVVDLSDKWRLVGWYLDVAVLHVMLVNSASQVRKLRAQKYKFFDRNLEVQLPEGGYVTSYSGPEQNNQARFLK
jgi:zona occludens toxin